MILFSVPLFILWKSKENFYSIDKIVLSENKYLISYAYNENNYGYLKWSYLNSNNRKSIWTLSSSTVLQFRSQMFDTSFYNAGFTIVSIYDFRQFLKSLPDNKYPDYLIIGLNHFMFNSAVPSSNSCRSVDSWQNAFTFYPNQSVYINIYKDLILGKYTFSSFQYDKSIFKIGINGFVTDNGFRNDGSRYYGGQIVKLLNNDSTARDYHYLLTFDRIKQGDRGFQYCKSVDPNALLELSELLQYCKDHKINVIAFLPPFADIVYNKMIESNNYNYLNELFNKVKPIFAKYNFEVYDFSHVSLCGSNDNETLDGLHGGAVTYQRLLISMLESGSILNQVTNIERLKKDLLNKKNNYVVYEE